MIRNWQAVSSKLTDVPHTLQHSSHYAHTVRSVRTKGDEGPLFSSFTDGGVFQDCGTAMVQYRLKEGKRAAGQKLASQVDVIPKTTLPSFVVAPPPHASITLRLRLTTTKLPEVRTPSMAHHDTMSALQPLKCLQAPPTVSSTKRNLSSWTPSSSVWGNKGSLQVSYSPRM